MTAIDDLLARALQLKDPQIPLDTVADDDSAYLTFPLEDLSPGESLGADLADITAASHLRSLCEVAVTRSTPGQITDFITEQVPEPRGAWILGCLLQLSDSEDGARFWWQYAAGAGDTAASYCLYLHHRALGDRRAAAFWHDQADTIADRLEEAIPTFLRILGHLTPAGEHAYTEATLAVMSYVTAAVSDGYARHPDCEIPLPGPYFAEHIQIILAATTTPPHRGQHPTTALPARRPPATGRHSPAASTNRRGRGPYRRSRTGSWWKSPQPTRSPHQRSGRRSPPAGKGSPATAPPGNGRPDSPVYGCATTSSDTR